MRYISNLKHFLFAEYLFTFISKIDYLFTILNQLDYIGKKRDTGIFVNENIVRNEKPSFFGNSDKDNNSPNSSPTFLAE